MMAGPGMRRLHLLASVLLLLTIAATAQAEVRQLDPSQSRGKQIYLYGTSDRSDEITATVGSEGLTLPASTVPCASCHGRDGLGRPEGGVLPPDLRWSELTKVYGHVHENGRKHEAFNEVSLARLIRSGRDPAHNIIDSSMPRYAMSRQDMDDLLAYIQVLEDDTDPGLEDDRIQVATLLPLRGPQASLGGAMAQVLLAYFKEINKDGGIYGRKLDLLAIPHGATIEETVDNLRSAFTREGVFAMVGAYTVGVDEAVLSVLRDEGAPLVGPFTLNPGDQFINTASFYMYSGFDVQTRALVQYALEEKVEGGVEMVLIGPEGDSVDRLISAAQTDLAKTRQSENNAIRYPQGELDVTALADQIEERASNAVLFLGSHAELRLLMSELDARKLSPRIYLLSAMVSRPLFDAPAAFDKRIYLAYPTTSSDLTVAGRSEYLRLADIHALPREHLQGQIAAFAAAKLLVEGLRGAGRTLSRQKLVVAIEALYRYDTGMTPPLTYGPNRRIGARGAHVLVVDLEKKANTSMGGWRELK